MRLRLAAGGAALPALKCSSLLCSSPLTSFPAGRRRFRGTRLPRFLVLHVRRFLKNQFFREKNPTIVNFPVKNLELAAALPVPKGELGVGGRGMRMWVAAR